MAGVDELHFHTYEPGYFYSIGFLHDFDVDNITIEELPQTCNGLDATVYVDTNGIVHGGEFDGQPYAGELHGTDGDDVIAGTPGNDTIQGGLGNDTLCGYDGDDAVHGGPGHDMIFGGNGDDTLTGHWDNDFIVGGEGRDNINGGAGANTCISGEVVNRCEGTGKMRLRFDAEPIAPSSDAIKDIRQR
jgi:Ca2+-binding RTX toxin-like protein